MNDLNHTILQSHSLKFLKMAFRTDRQESVRHADGHGKKASACGDTIEFFLMVKKDRIQSISYALNGCINTNACANAVIDLVEGKSISQAWKTYADDISQYLESLPKEHFHCAELAVAALQSALSNAREIRKAPWKKIYS